MRTYFRILLLVLILAAVAVGISPVSADPCTIQPSSLAYTVPQTYYTSGVVVPVSATCSFPGGQLSIVGQATDASTNAHVGSAGAVLSAAYGLNTYTGQLVFNLPPQVIGHTLQISISIYGGIYNSIYGYSNVSPLTTSVETVQVTTQVNSTNYYNNYPNCYYNNCGYYSQSNNNQLQCPPLSVNTVQCIGNSNNYNNYYRSSIGNSNNYYSNFPSYNNPNCYYNNNCVQMYNSPSNNYHYNNQLQCVGNSNNYYSNFPSYNNPNCYYNNNCGYYSQSNNNQLQCNYAICFYNNNCNQMYNTCQLPISNNQVQCVGVLSKNSSACVILKIPLYSALGSVSYQYYSLQNLPSSYPAIGTWVFVAGQFNQGNNISPTGAACPGNYISVAIITPT